jgi:hypothetical protein
MKALIKQGFLLCLLAAGITAGASSCVVTAHPHHHHKHTTVKKKPHPHGGPPGQTKKGHGHHGKRHFIVL